MNISEQCYLKCLSELCYRETADHTCRRSDKEKLGMTLLLNVNLLHSFTMPVEQNVKLKVLWIDYWKNVHERPGTFLVVHLVKIDILLNVRFIMFISFYVKIFFYVLLNNNSFTLIFFVVLLLIQVLILMFKI